MKKYTFNSQSHILICCCATMISYLFRIVNLCLKKILIIFLYFSLFLLYKYTTMFKNEPPSKKRFFIEQSYETVCKSCRMSMNS